MIKFTIEGGVVYPEIGLRIGEDKTEVFDDGEIELKNTTKSTAYIFGDYVKATIGDVEKEYIVEQDRITQVTDELTDHLITLTEFTAKLTKEIHTDRFFTVKSDGEPYSLAEIAEIIVATEPFGKTDLFRIEADTLTALDVPGRELKMKQRNVFQKYVQLFKNIKAVPRMDRRSIISHTYYNSVNNPITIDDLMSSNKVISANDYANTVITKANNAVFDGTVQFGSSTYNLNRGVYFPTKTSGVTVRATKGDYEDKNAEFQLPMAIRKMYKVKIMNLSTLSSGTIEADITDYVVSKEKFDKLPVGSNVTILDAPYQRNTLYYTKGGNTISNMATTYKVFGISDIDALEALIRAWLDEQAAGAGLTEYVAQDINDYEFNFFFQPYNDIDISRERFRNDVTKTAMILSNQRESVVELQRYAGVMGDTIRRLPNGNWLITKEYTNFADRFELGDYTSDSYQVIKSSFIVYSETRIIGFHELAQYWATIDGQQSTNREPQPYTMSKETQKANFRYTEYIELSTTSRATTGGLTPQGFRTLLNLFEYFYTDNTPIVLAQYTNADSGQAGYAINVGAFPSASEGGINLITGFLEPELAGNQLNKSGNDELVPVRYTDEGGGVDVASFKFINDVTIDPDIYPKSVYQSTTLFELNDKTYSLDPNEILGLNVELLWSSDEDGIIIGDRMNEYCNLTWEFLSRQDVNLAIYLSDATVQYNEMDKFITNYNSRIVNDAEQININKTARRLIVSPTVAAGTWAIGFAVDDSLIMAVNHNGTDRGTIYFNNLVAKTGIESLLYYLIEYLSNPVGTVYSSLDTTISQALNYETTISLSVTASSLIGYEVAGNSAIEIALRAYAASEIVSSQRLDYGVVAEFSAIATMIMEYNQLLDYSVVAEFEAVSSLNVVTEQRLDYGVIAEFEATAIMEMVYETVKLNHNLAVAFTANATSAMVYEQQSYDKNLVAEFNVSTLVNLEHEIGKFNYSLATEELVTATMNVTYEIKLNVGITMPSVIATSSIVYVAQLTQEVGITMPSVTATLSMSHRTPNNETLAVELAASTLLAVEYNQASSTTATPSIVDSYYNANTKDVGWKVKNLDTTGIATLYSDMLDSTPTEFVDTDIAYNATGVVHIHATINGGTIYAKAQVSGELLSDYTSQYEGV